MRTLEEELYQYAAINQLHSLSIYQLRELLFQLKYHITLNNCQSLPNLQSLKEDISHLSREDVISLIQLIIHHIY